MKNRVGLLCDLSNWTLAGLVLAFVDLLVAYVLLCVSAGVFFLCKFLVFVGNSLPCPCTGLFGFRSSELCWHSLLIDRPIKNIGCVMELVKSRVPFGLVCSRDQNPDFEVSRVGDRRHGVSCCGSCGRGSGYDVKGKRIVNKMNKYGIRRRRRAVLGDWKFSNGSNSVCASDAVCRGIVRSLDLRSLSEFAIPDNKNVENGIDPIVSIGQYLEEDGFDEKGKAVELGSSSDKFACNREEGLGCAENEANQCRLLEKALREEKVARAALYLELEKERAAAATAADEAMAMILRLQEEKASIEMEARQYQRMIEEKFAYDEEEMDILKEILVRRERENHYLERKLEAYGEIDVSSNEELDEGDFAYRKYNGELNPLLLNKSTSSDQQETATSSSIRLDAADAFDRNGKEPENDEEQRKLKDGDDYSSQTDAESTVYDIHVIDDKSIIWKENDGEESRHLGRRSSDSGVCSCEVLRDCPSKSMSEVEPSDSAVHNDLETNSMYPVAGGRLKTDSEVEWLRERPRTVQAEKEKLIPNLQIST